MKKVRQTPTGKEAWTSTPASRRISTQPLSKKRLLPTASARMAQSKPLSAAARSSFNSSSILPSGSMM